MNERMEIKIDERLKAILLAMIIIVLCLTSIVGATLALFTNDEKDGTIGVNVTTGRVRVDIVNTEQTSLIGSALDFVHTNQDGDPLFEPGATYYTEGFQVKNVGEIPVNFRMYISSDANINMEEFEKAFELRVTTNPRNLDDADPLKSFTGRLEVGQNSDTYYLIVRMREDAGNEFQNQTYTGIGITVYAVQGNATLN